MDKGGHSNKTAPQPHARNCCSCQDICQAHMSHQNSRIPSTGFALLLLKPASSTSTVVGAHNCTRGSWRAESGAAARLHVASERSRCTLAAPCVVWVSWVAHHSGNHVGNPRLQAFPLAQLLASCSEMTPMAGHVESFNGLACEMQVRISFPIKEGERRGSHHLTEC